MNSHVDEEFICCASASCKIIHIPEKSPIDPHQQPTVDVLACEIDPKNANTLVRKLNHIAPLEGLRHVKRIRKTVLDDGSSRLFVILCLSTGEDGDGSNIPEDVLQLVNSYQLSTFSTKVCKYAASTKEEWQEQCKLWPTSFHPPTYNIDGITGFSEEDTMYVLNNMKLAIQMAKSGSLVANAAVIVDPSTRKVIASSSDEVFSPTACAEPCSSKHTEAVNLEIDSYNYNVACLHPWGWIERKLQSSLDSWHPLRHAAIVAIDKSSARDRQLYPLVDGYNAEFLHKAENASPLKRQKINVKDGDETDSQWKVQPCDSTRPYLCTGYDIYFVWEPCIMCAMAIVHQRIRRVFYALPNPNHGGLGSVHRLQGEKSLNHHYAVFRVVIPEDLMNESVN